MKAILNISAYRFVSIPDPLTVRERVQAQAAFLDLKGTVLLAEEGINLFLAGHPVPLREFVQWLRNDPRFGDLETKESWSDALPFDKLKIKVKAEIIRMNCPQVRPAAARAPTVDAATLQRWLSVGADDDGRAVVMLDTRNKFEVDQGRFAGAIDFGLHKFSDFPDALLAHAAELRDKTVVSYCTGGIRCEKAALFMADAGIAHVRQLDGGILKYFEQTKGTHFEGHCFVFDQREAVDAELRAVAS